MLERLSDFWPFLAVATGVATLPLLLNVLRGFLDRKLVGDVFNVAAVVACLATGQWVTAALIVAIAHLGALLERKAAIRAGHDARALAEAQPLTATRERHKQTEEVKTEGLSIGDILVVQQGQRVPADGVIIQGTAHVDQSALSGEIKPIEKLVGDGVLASNIVKAGHIKLRVTRTLQGSAIERILFLLQDAGRHPAPVERAAERLSGLFLVGMGLAGLAAWLLLQDVNLMAAFFLIAGGDALAQTIRLLIATTLARGARHGTVIKHGRWIEPLAELNAIILEKTGLMTHADLHVGRLEHDPSVSDAFVWECVAVAEKYSEHPAGRALFRMAAKHIGAMPDPDEFQVFPSKGVRAILAGHEVMVGTAELLRAREISFDQPWLAGSTSPIEGTGSDVFVALDGSCIARVRLQDRPRNDIRESLQRLHELGIQTQILFTNDTVRVAGSFAQAIGISEYRPSMKPEDTWHEIGRLAQHGTVALLGDSQQHTSALVRADLGVVLSQAGRGLHTESAGLVLMTDDLTRMPELILLARRTKRTWKYLILYWLVANVLWVSLVLLKVLAPLPTAIFALLVLRLPLLNASRWMEKRAVGGQAAQIGGK
ncbi:cation-translocating P-type ATPase [Candidatus Uhrbacteria bacterium]|nr:cation-translocating P-type ATPase [Candidatus Uhrbacteria bacterium]